MEDKITEYYSKFKEIYTKENYPEWFEFFKSYNGDKGYGDKGYIEYEKEHELGHYAILQTHIPELQKIPEETKIVIVGKNNSWFIPDKYRVKESLDIVKGLETGIPDRNFYTERESDFAKDICSIFEDLGSYKLLEKNTVGMNRVWLQTGPYSKNIEKMKESRKGASLKEEIEGSSIVDKCHQWTEEIIELLNPDLVLILGTDPNGADRLFNKMKGIYEYKKGQFFIKHCRHPSVGGKTKAKKHIEQGLDELRRIYGKK